MRPTNPRIHTVLERPLYKAVETMASEGHVSLSQMVRDLVKESVELMEDRGLQMIVEERRKKPGRLISHAEMMKRLKLD